MTASNLSRSCLLLSFFSIIGTGVFAGTTAQNCTVLEDDAARLACYDRLFALHAPAPVLPTENASASASANDVAGFQQQTGMSAQGHAEKETAAAEPSLLDKLFELDENNKSGVLTLSAYRPLYFLPAWYNSRPGRTISSPTQATVTDSRSDQQKIEAKMQISFKSKLLENVLGSKADVWFGYTQQSHWQVYNRANSSDFRNTDYMPELFATIPVSAKLPAGGRLRMLGGGYLHQSNGESDPLSRSWNRLYVMAGAEWGNLTVIPRLWWRIPESYNSDDNPDITRYMGYGDVRLQYRFANKQTLGATLRYNPKSGKSGIQADYAFPIAGKLKIYIQGFSGYGENLIDYNHRHNSIGIGLMMNDEP